MGDFYKQDMRRIASVVAAAYLRQIDEAGLSDGFWCVALLSALETTSTAGPYYQPFRARKSQVVHAGSYHAAARSPRCTNSQ